MKIIRNTKTISELYESLKKGDIIINREYQRSDRLWPQNSRSYFIDTVLNEYPFPKIVLWQKLDIHTKKIVNELIDGQQRLTTIRDFIDNKFKLSSVSKKYAGKEFDTLNDEEKRIILTYEVSLDNIISADDQEILEIFKRLNSYTLVLSKMEQRYATYQGEFKWFINDLTEIITPFLRKYEILTDREISRMADDDLLTECCQIYLNGIIARSNSKLDGLYRENDKEFPLKEKLRCIILQTFEYLRVNFIELFESNHIASYNFYSIMGAFIYRKFGFYSDDNNFNNMTESLHENFCSNVYETKNNLLNLFSVLNRDFQEENITNIDKNLFDFREASSASTHTMKNRQKRHNCILVCIK